MQINQIVEKKKEKHINLFPLVYCIIIILQAIIKLIEILRSVK